ncbi:MAG: DUF4215 domain-containing protein, partial [bacterium]
MRWNRWWVLVPVAVLAQGCVFDSSGKRSGDQNNNTASQNNNNDQSNSNNNNVQPPGCGDGAIDTQLGETCDDGNAAPGDGCASNCRTEGGWACTGEPSVCETVCGDGVLLPGHEGCDDDNNSPNDGCSTDCQVEQGYACSGQPSVCTATCADGVVALGAEGCDDGNLVAGDGCGADCLVEPGYVCFGSPSVCNFTCGNGTLDTGEACDDGNTSSCDGCAGDCSHFDDICGDGFQECGEACDDGNTNGCDGCAADCSRLDAQCGDGIQECLELCDDGNTDSCDGCAGDCSRTDDVCGDNILECGEVCDVGDTNSCDGCSSDCSRQDDFCGDGIRECGEACEGADFGSATCSSVTGGTLPNGTLTCTGSCTVDTSGCAAGGCTLHSECPLGEQCIANACQAVGNTCGDSPFVLGSSGSRTHTLANLTNDYNAGDNNGLSCPGISIPDSAGADRVYEIPMTAGDYITVWVTSQGGWNPVLYLSDSCPINSCLFGRNLADQDPAPERIDYVATSSTTIYLVVDGDPNGGDFTLNVTRGAAGDWDMVDATGQV